MTRLYNSTYEANANPETEREANNALQTPIAEKLLQLINNPELFEAYTINALALLQNNVSEEIINDKNVKFNENIQLQIEKL